MKKNRLNIIGLILLFLALLATYLFLNIKTNTYPWKNNIQIARHSVDYVLGFASLCVFLAVILKINKYLRIVVYFFVIIMFVNIMASASGFFIYKENFTKEMAYSTLSTSFREVSSIQSTLGFPLFFSVLYTLLFAFLIEKLSKIIKVNFVSILASTIWVILPIVWVCKEKYDIEKYRKSHPGYGVHFVEPKFVFQTMNSFYGGFDYLMKIRSIKNFKADFSSISKIEKFQDDEIDKIIVVLGESARVQNMSLYGYGRATTPEADKERQNMFVYNNAVSPAFVTYQAVPLTLSNISMDNYAESNFSQIADNIISVGQNFNRKSYWITGTKSEEEYLLTYNANQLIETKAMYDEEMLPHFRKLLNKKEKQLIVLHLLGSHSDAKNNYPKSHNVFKKDNTVDAYDNSITYSDYLLGQIFSDLKGTNSALLYYSDHGQAHSNDKFFHSQSKSANRVPLFMWYGDKVPTSMREIGVENKETSTKIVYSLVLRLMGLENSKTEAYQPAKFLKDGEVVFFNQLKE